MDRKLRDYVSHASRLREYINNPHHVNPNSVSFENAIREAADMLVAAPKHPQDMSLRELFDHVAIVNDAVRAAIAGHPGCEPVRRDD